MSDNTKDITKKKRTRNLKRKLFNPRETSLLKCKTRGESLSHPSIIEILKAYQWGEWRYDGSETSLKNACNSIKEEIYELALDGVIDSYHWDYIKVISLQDFSYQFSKVFSYTCDTNYLQDPAIIEILKLYDWRYAEVLNDTYSNYDDIINDINNLYLSGLIKIDRLNCIKNRSKEDFFINFREIFYYPYVFETYVNINIRIIDHHRTEEIDDVEKRDLLNFMTEVMYERARYNVEGLNSWREVNKSFEYPESPLIKKFASIASDILLILEKWEVTDLNSTLKFCSKIESMVEPLRYTTEETKDLTRNDENDYSLDTYTFSLQVDSLLRTIRRWKFLQSMSIREFSLQIRDASKGLREKAEWERKQEALYDAQYHPYGRDK